MLQDILRESPDRAASESNSQLIPDPWELPIVVLETKSAQSWQLPVESHPLISPGGNPAALQLPSPKSNPVQLLLQDWLKLRAEQARKLADNLSEALGLLCWMEMMAY